MMQNWSDVLFKLTLNQKLQKFATYLRNKFPPSRFNPSRDVA